MSKIWFTSDTHFCHDRGFLYEPRGFTSVEDMNEAIVQRWNSVVAPEDTVYHLGDGMLNDTERGMEFLKQLNGKIIMIRGNHDTNPRVKAYADAPNVIESGKYADVVTYKKIRFYISHYPTMTSNLEKGASLREHTINLYGHTHQMDNFYQDIPFMYHVGMDSHNCYPVDIDTIIEDIKAKAAECISMLGESEDAE